MFAAGENPPIFGIWQTTVYPKLRNDHLALLGRKSAGGILRKTSKQKDMLHTFLSKPTDTAGLCCCLAGPPAPQDAVAGRACVCAAATGMADRSF